MLPLSQPQLCTNPPGFRDGTLVKCMEFILSPFLNYNFIFISLVFSRRGVWRKEKGRREAVKSTSKIFLLPPPYFCAVSELSAPSKVERFNGSCRDTNLFPMKLGLTRHVMNTMKTEFGVGTFIIWLITPLG